MGLNVSNMPVNTLYQFDDNRYVIALMLNETRNGNYKSNTPNRFTEVYSVDGNGFMNRLASGGLVNNPDVYDFDKDFAIRDYDMDEVYSFAVNMPLKEIPQGVLHELLRESISRSYESSKK